MSNNQDLLPFPDGVSPVPAAKPVNVASVPQYSPFRYPGGKTWFVPTFRRWIQSLPGKPEVLIEPFAGGGITGLTAAMEGLVRHVIMVELDAEVASVWQTILDGNAEWLANRIRNFEMSMENAKAILTSEIVETREKAFATILKNRVLHGGILAKGSSFIRKGENGKGIGSRWYPETLAKRILRIAHYADRFTFIHGDGLQVMEEYAENSCAAFFVDPPYTVGGKRAGRRLYTHHQIDHENLFSLCQQLSGSFLLTYDDTEVVRELAQRHAFGVGKVPMKNTHHATRHELVISRDLSWL